MPKAISNLDEAVAVFIEGARIHHTAMYIDDKKMAMRGLVRTEQGSVYIDRHSPNARDILIPLLEHEDDAVRVTAASALIQSRPDLAIPMLQHLSDTCLTEAHLTAGMMLSFKRVFGFYGMGVCKPDPRFPLPTKPETTS